ncbi:MAG: hypothetical protein SFV21_08475 [Rhodospirillaceae bacterium]|nr:hypothetical protein [Rhodospirillaceae bacterium]
MPAWVHTPDLLRRFVVGQMARGIDPARIRLPTDQERIAEHAHPVTAPTLPAAAAVPKLAGSDATVSR